MQPIILIILVITKDYLDKTVMLPGKGTFIKGIDTMLPEWLLVAVSRLKSLAAPGSVVEMIRNWNNKKNKIFNFSIRSQDASKFKATKCR